MTPRRLVALSAGLLLVSPALARAGAGAAPRAAGKQVIVLVGMPGSGKTTAAERLTDALAARGIGAHFWTSGDVVRGLAKKQWDSEGRARDYKEVEREVAERLAREQPGGIGRIMARRVARAREPVVVIDGFRSPADLDAVRARHPATTVVALEVGTAERYRRMAERKRTPGEDARYYRERDRSEIQRGVRRLMGRADLRLRPRPEAGLAGLDRSLARVVRRVAARTGPRAGVAGRTR